MRLSVNKIDANPFILGNAALGQKMRVMKPFLEWFEGFAFNKPPASDLTHKLHLIAVPLGNLESP
jgi:hypothetical protein